MESTNSSEPHNVHGHGLNLKRFERVAVVRENEKAGGYFVSVSSWTLRRENRDQHTCI